MFKFPDGSKANKTQEDWIEPTLLNGWVEYNSNGTPRYYKNEFGTVTIIGYVKNGTPNTVVFILPEGYRPEQSVTFLLPKAGGNYELSVSSNGEVKIGSSGSATLSYFSSISFRAV